MIQPLESRVLLAASYASNVLTVTGTNGDDVIRLAVTGDSLALYEGGKQTGSFKKVQSIIVRALDGRDRVTVDPSITVKAQLEGGNQADTLSGGSGPNVLLGQGGHDHLIGGKDIDALIGGNGDDLLDGGAGNDYLDGQAGLDTVTYANRKTPVTAELGWIWTYASDGNGVGEGYTTGSGGVAGETDNYQRIDTLIGTSGDDQLSAFHHRNHNFSMSVLPLRMYAGAGKDVLKINGAWDPYGKFSPTLHGGEGEDLLTYKADNSGMLLGEGGADTLIVPNDGLDDHYTGADGGPGIDLQIVGDQPVKLGSHAFKLGAGFERAEIHGAERFIGNELDNEITVFNSYYYRIEGGGGNDRIDARRAESGYHDPMVIDGGQGNDVIFGSRFDDRIVGGLGDDAIFGFNGIDTLEGAEGNDYLEGGEGDDSIVGGIGNDTLRGGAGIDRLEGNEGDDVFFARDGEKDFLYGGDGEDSTQRDSAEAVVDSVESTVA